MAGTPLNATGSFESPLLSSGVEPLVGWLLDHPDIHTSEVSDADTVSDEDSDEEVFEELEEAEPVFAVVRHHFTSASSIPKLFLFFIFFNALIQFIGSLIQVP